MLRAGAPTGFPARHFPGNQPSAMLRQTLFFLLCALPVPCLAQIYKYIDPEGAVAYADRPGGGGRGIEDLPDVVPLVEGEEGEPLHAAMTVYVSETMVEFSYRFCRDRVPQMQGTVHDARNQWNTLNVAIRKKKIKVLHDHYSPDQLRKMASETEGQQMALLRKVGAASRADQERWCEEAPARFQSASMSPVLKPALVRAIDIYKPLDR
jgi:hypothetical protein